MGITWDGTDFWIVSDNTDEVYKYTSAGVYTGVHFDVGDTYPVGITWDGTDFWIVDYTNKEVYKYTSAGVYTGVHFDVGTEDTSMWGITWDGTYFWIVGMVNDEVFQYGNFLDVSKVYQGSGYTYMQTNTTELISLKSQDYTTHYNLSSGDYFEIDFQTSSDSKIELILLKDGGENKTLTLSQSGNANFNRHTAKISVDEFVEFDQLKISSIFEDTDNVKIYDIKTYKYEVVGDYADFYVGSKRTHLVNLTSETYNLRIFEEGDEKINENITIETSDYFYIYTPIETLDCRLSLYNPSDVQLEFTDYHIVVNRSLNGEWNTFNLLDNIFIADEESHVYVNVSDRFDTLIDSFDKIASSYIDLELEVYQLQIKNLMEQQTTVDINTTHVYPLLSGDSLYFMLAKDYYQIGFYDEYDLYKNFTIYLSSNQAYQLNCSLKTIYFSMFTYDGLGIDHDLVRFYINGDRKDLGFNSMLEDTLELVILDFFNNTLANETIDANAYTNSEYNLYVQIYSMYILNQFTYSDLIFNITQVGSGMWMNQLIPSTSALLYRFIPNINYTINATYVNGTVYSIRTINLTDNSQIESFGVPSAPSEYPKDVYFGVYTTTGLGIDRGLLRFYIDGSRTDFGFNRITDEITNITVRDFFNTTMFTQLVNFSGVYEYDILITLYSLKVKNEAQEIANYTLSYGALETTGYILPEEVIEYQLSSNNYVFDYTNNEDGSFGTINVNLNQNRVYILNSTYYTAYFGLFDQYDHRLDNSLFSLYLNGTRKDFGFIELSSDYYNIVVYDWLNVSVFNQITYLFNYTEYNIYITVFELQIRHLAFENSNLTLCETISGNYINFSMAPDTIRSFMLSNSAYNITWINGENLISTIYDITLDENYILTLSSTYYNIYFNLYDLNLHTIDPYQYIFRLNGTIQDFGSIIDLQTDDYNITITDRFGTSLFNSIITLRGLNEYRIDISLYEIQIIHLARENSNVSLYETTSHNGLNFSMAPDTIRSFVLGSSTYNITWINNENGLTTIYDITLSSDYILTLDTTFYNAYFSLYDQGGVRLDDSLFSLYINTTRKDFGFVELETNNTLIVVQDYLNVTVFNQVVALRGLAEYNIYITVFELQIRHLALENSNLTLYETTSGNYINFSMSPDSLNKYMLSNSTYNITWINGENLVSTLYNITLDENYILLLDTTYYDVYIGLYNFYGVVNPEEVKFYINNTRADFGFNTIKSEYAILTVLDYFNSSLYSQVVRLEGLREYSIFIQAYTLVVNNLYNNQSITIEMTRGTITVERLIEAQGWTEFKLFANVIYEIISYVNDTMDEEKEVLLDEEYKTVSFGFFKTEMPIIPEPISPPSMIDAFIMLAIFISVVMVVIGSFLYFKIRGGTNRSVRASTDGEYNAYRSLGINWGRVGLFVLLVLFLIGITLIYIGVTTR